MIGQCDPTGKDHTGDLVTQRTPLVFSTRVVVVASVLAAMAIAAVGSLSDVCLGDENPHVRHVRAQMRTFERVAYDPAFNVSPNMRLATYNTPLWHTGLAVLWRVTGRESQVLAQVYHALFYLLCVLSVYFAARRMWGASAASWAWILVATTPMVCAYSILLFQDVPGLAISALAVWMLWRKNYLSAGLALAAAYFTKMNMLSFAPWAVLFAGFWAGPSWKRRLRAAALVAAPVALIFAYDIAWRSCVYDGSLTGWRMSRSLQTAKAYVEYHAAVVAAARKSPGVYKYWQPFTVFELDSIVSNVGVAVLVALAVALLRAWDRASLWLWACLILAMAGFVVIFGQDGPAQVRYLLPLLLPAVLLGAKGLSRWRATRWVKAVVVAVCALQAVAACGHVWYARRIPEQEKQAYAWMRRNVAPNTRIMSPEQLITNQTGREFIWGYLWPAYFMSEADDETRIRMLKFFKVSHIAVPLRRTYDPAVEGNHAGGFNKDFVEQMRSAPYLEAVYDQPGFLIFRFRPQAGAPGEEPATSPAELPASSMSARALSVCPSF